MIKKKICLLGAFAVGKTSLVRQFVASLFSDQYHSTVGVKTDKKVVNVGAQEVMLLIWDIAGEDEFQRLHLDYLRGAAGYLLVADGTRRDTLDLAVEIQQRVTATIGALPFVLIINKADLTNEWEVDESAIAALPGWSVLKGSARTGESVEEAFRLLAEKMLQL